MAQKPALGLSITDATLEALQLTEKNGKFSVSSYSWSRLPEGVVASGKVSDSFALAEELKKLLSSAQPKTMKGPVILSLPQSHVFLKVFTIPAFEDKDMDEAINWHIGSLKPVLPQQAYTSHEVIGKTDDNQARVLLAAASETVVDGYLSVMSMAEIEVDAIEPMALAKARLIDIKNLVDKNVASVHLYGGMLTVSILVSGKVWFSQETVTAVDGSQIRNSVDEIVNFFSEKKEIDLAGISQVIYSGDVAGIDLVARNLVGYPIPIARADAGVMLQPSSAITDIDNAQFAPVLGLAIRGILQQKGLINLLPQWPQQKLKYDSFSKLFKQSISATTFIVWATVIGTLGLRFWIAGRIQNLGNQTSVLTQRLNEQQEVEMNAWGNNFNQVVSAAEKIQETRLTYSQILSTLASATPNSVTITAFSYETNKGQWSIAGVANTREDVLLLNQELKKTNFFSDAKLFFSSLETDLTVAFRLSGGQNAK
jgi:Tfp pilus assembly protein PilN